MGCAEWQLPTTAALRPPADAARMIHNNDSSCSLSDTSLELGAVLGVPPIEGLKAGLHSQAAWVESPLLAVCPRVHSFSWALVSLSVKWHNSGPPSRMLVKWHTQRALNPCLFPYLPMTFRSTLFIVGETGLGEKLHLPRVTQPGRGRTRI